MKFFDPIVVKNTLHKTGLPSMDPKPIELWFVLIEKSIGGKLKTNHLKLVQASNEKEQLCPRVIDGRWPAVRILKPNWNAIRTPSNALY